MMKAVKQNSFGGFEAYEFTSVEKPTMGPDQIFVKVYAAGVNPVDTYVRQGALNYKNIPVPIIPGQDFSGVVEACGENVANQYPAGTRVWVTKVGSYGAYAEYAVATPGKDFIGIISNNMTYEQGAAIGIPYMTVFDAMNAGKISTGQTVVIHGASGGVGIAACNVAAFMGCNVVATVGTEAGEQNAKKAGAKAVFYHNKEGYVAEMTKYAQDNFGQIDAVIDNAAHINMNFDLEMVKPGGNVVVVGCRGPHNTNVRMILAKRITVSGVYLFNAGKENLDNFQANIQKMIDANAANPVCNTFSFEEYTNAQTEVITPSSGGAKGKVVIKIN